MGRNNGGGVLYISGADIFIELKTSVTQVITGFHNPKKRLSNILSSKVGLFFKVGLRQGKNHGKG